MSTFEFTKVSTFFASNQESCDRVLQMVSLLGNGVRFKLLCALKEGDFCVGELAELVGGKPANVSQQLKMLSLAGYVSSRREDQNVIYTLESEQVRRAVQFFQDEFTGSRERQSQEVNT